MRQIHSSPAHAKAGTIADAGTFGGRTESFENSRRFVRELRLITCGGCSIDSRRTRPWLVGAFLRDARKRWQWHVISYRRNASEIRPDCFKIVIL